MENKCQLNIRINQDMRDILANLKWNYNAATINRVLLHGMLDGLIQWIVRQGGFEKMCARGEISPSTLWHVPGKHDMERLIELRQQASLELGEP